MKLVSCEVGMFKMPGILVQNGDEEDAPNVTEEQLAEMEAWCNSEFGTGMRMNERLFSFRNLGQRDWFILRWSS
jgi:hypothetical protein